MLTVLCGSLSLRCLPQRLKRTGWVNNKVHLPESVADHMYRMGMCCMLIDDSNTTVNRSKCVLLFVLVACSTELPTVVAYTCLAGPACVYHQ